MRLASDTDSADILAWRNDSESVEMSLSQDFVAPHLHDDWFQASLKSPRCVHLVGEILRPGKFSEKVGVCRFDEKKPNEWVVSIAISPAQRGKSLGTAFLAASIDFFRRINSGPGVTLKAEIRPNNPKSIAIFEKNGFQLVDSSGEILSLCREFS